MKRKSSLKFIQLLVMLALLVLSAFACKPEPTVAQPAATTAISEPSATASETTQLIETTGTERPKIERPSFTSDTYPRVDGSTATIPLSEHLAAALLDLSATEAKSFIHHNTTHPAYVNLIEGRADIIFVTEPSADELALAQEQGIALEVVPVVKEAFVFLVNVDNPVEVISQQQIRDIYQGKITNWQDLGGPDKAIIAYQRPENSGSQTLMQSLVMKDLELAPAPTALKPEEMSGLIEVIAAYDNSDQAIGYSVYYYAHSMYSQETIKFVKVDGILPDPATISSGSYPYTSAYYAVLRKSERANAPARQLLAWLLSPEGQQLAQDSGYVPLQVVTK